MVCVHFGIQNNVQIFFMYIYTNTYSRKKPSNYAADDGNEWHTTTKTTKNLTMNYTAAKNNGYSLSVNGIIRIGNYRSILFITESHRYGYLYISICRLYNHISSIFFSKNAKHY